MAARRLGEVSDEMVAPGGEQRLRRAERAENFSVALRVLPARRRAALRAVYDVLRTVDDLGDEAPGDRGALLDALSADLERTWAGHSPHHPALARLAPWVAALRLPREDFDALVAANHQDQVVTRYPTRAALHDYCLLSAAPVGRLVLAVFEVEPTPARLAASDRVCVALQMLEHLADVAEDRARGRVYLPVEVTREHGAHEDDLDRPHASTALRRAVLAETRRAVADLVAGSTVVGGLRGAPRLAVAGYVAGGLAAADALRRVGGDVLGRTARTRRRDVARHLVRVVLEGRA